MDTQRKWTPEQLAGITTVGRSLLVSAAAGSGKTAVLAERCAHLVCDAKPRCDIDQLLVVTFTESAAAEMKSRIQDALRRRLTSTPDDRLKRQIALAEHANVSTVHGFCARLLRQNFNLLGLDPFFEILDGDEASLLRAEVARDLFDRRYETDDTGDFQRLIDAYGDGDDQRLIDHVIATHQLLCSLVDPEGWIARVNAELSESAELPLEQSTLGKRLINLANQSLDQLARRCNAALSSVRAIAGFPAYVTLLEELSDTISHWRRVLANDGLDMLASEVKDTSQSLPRAPAVRGNPPGKDLAKSLLDSVKKAMHEGPLVDLLSCNSAQWRDGMASVAPQSTTFLNLVQQFSDAYTEAKQNARALDFSDLERNALDVLRDPAQKTLRPSPVALATQQQFHHVLVDEYQDINEIQDAILTLASRESAGKASKLAPNLFCVGDVKQSIFRFRLAEPARFLDRQQRFLKSGPAGSGQVIDLRENFRSRSQLLDAINSVFERLMTRESAEIEYDQTHRLRCGRDYPAAQPNHFPGSPIELHLMPLNLTVEPESPDAPPSPSEPDEQQAELERAEYEAILVARRIRALMGMDGAPPMQVIKPDPTGNLTPQPIAFGDIVILLRSLLFKADTFADVLRAHGIPVHSEGGSGFFTATEIRDILSLLEVLDNQQQDIPLAALLRSPIANIPQPDDALARIRLAYPPSPDPIPFHEAVRRYAAEQSDELAAQLRDFFTTLNDWRDQSRKRPVAELLWDIYDQTGYLAFCAGLEDGAQRVANLVELHERARQFGTFLRQGLYRFLRFLQTLRQQRELSRPPVAAETESVVRIMSIHRSKGLEFPIVILPDLGKKHNLSDTAGAILVDRCAGLGMDVIDQARRIRYPSLASTLVKASLLKQTLAEEMRLLYVAMTRAKEHLILVGSAPNTAMDRWLAQWQARPGPLPADAVLGGKTQLDWLGPIAAMTADLPPAVFTVQCHQPAEILAWQSPRDFRSTLTPQQKTMATLQPLSPSPAPTEISQRVAARFARAYQYETYTNAPASAAVTTYAAHPLPAAPAPTGEILPDRKLDLPRFTQQQLIPTAADIGTITHRVLQHWQFNTPGDPADIDRQIDSLIQRKMISPDHARHIDRPAIAWLLSTDVGLLLRDSHDSLLRELPFAMAIPAPSNDPLDQLMIRGRIDLLVPHNDTLSIIDYKTDRVTGPALQARSLAYQSQMTLYRDAIEKITHKKVDAIYLIFLSARHIAKC